jgi:hypothetical protein
MWDAGARFLHVNEAIVEIERRRRNRLLTGMLNSLDAPSMGHLMWHSSRSSRNCYERAAPVGASPARSPGTPEGPALLAGLRDRLLD